MTTVIKAVIFDLGRVMVTLDASGEKFGGLMREVGVAPDTAMETFWHTAEVRGFMTGALTPAEFHEALRERYGMAHDFPAFAEAWCDLFRPMPGMAELFAGVALRFRTGVLSDTDPLHWERIRRAAPCLEAVRNPTLSHRVGELKPHPAMYRAAVAAAGVLPGECVFIDDKQENVDGAKKEGLRAVRFEGAENLARALAELGVRL